MWHVQLLAGSDVQNVPGGHGKETTTGTWTQTESSVHIKNASEMHQEKATERPATTPSEGVSRAEAALKAAEMAELAEDIITNLRGETSRMKKEQLKQRPVGKPLDAAKTVLTHAATLMTKRHQEVAAAGRSKGR